MLRWPFHIVDDHGKPKYEVLFKGNIERFSPEQISAAVLSKLKKTAEKFLNEAVTDAVITVPAHFTDAQRQATKDAAEIAGLNVLQLLNEPTAAAVAYGLSQKVTCDQNILVFDLGGGTFDVSILTIDNEVYDVKAVGGDNNLGGEDFNNKMLDHFIKEIQYTHNVDVSNDRAAIVCLLKECEVAKIALSRSTVADFNVNFNGINFKSSITRARFEELNADFFDKAIKIVEETILEAKLQKSDIHEVVLVGGSTYIPRVQKMLQDCFNGKTLNKSIKPDEAVAYGAAVLAANLCSSADDDDDDFDLVLLDVTPMSLGTDLKDDKMSVIISKNTPIPYEKTIDYTTVCDNQSLVKIGVYEGENEDVSKNNLLGDFHLAISPAKAGEPCIKVTMEINANGILRVHAVNTLNDVENSIVIDEYKNRLTQDEIEESKKIEVKMLKP